MRGRADKVNLKWLAVTVVITALLVATKLQAFTLADGAIEMKAGVEPNIVLLLDNSGSMDWEVLTQDFDGGGVFSSTQPDGAGGYEIKHRSGCGSGTHYYYVVQFLKNGLTGDCVVAADNAWRMRNSDYNPLYFDPRKDYSPWVGLNDEGDRFADIPIDDALENPWDPASETIDLTSKGSINQSLDGGFRFYTWSDDGDGLFENGEETEYRVGDLRDAQVAILNSLRSNDGSRSLTRKAYQQNFANWFSYYRKREYVMKAALGEVLGDITHIRVGFSAFKNADTNNRRIKSMNTSAVSGNKRSLLDGIYSVDSDGNTSTRGHLQNVGRYFSCELTDRFGCPALPEAEGGSCQQNNVLLLTDGFYNGTSPGVSDQDGDTENPFDGGAFADSIENTLADVAMYYYKNDLQPEIPNHVPATSYDINRYPDSNGYPVTESGAPEFMHQHMVTYVLGFGVQGTIDTVPAKPEDRFNWSDPGAGNAEKIDDLMHAAYNGRGLYLSALDHETLKNSLQAAFAQMQAETGTASAVTFNTHNLQDGSRVYRAFFNAMTKSGDLKAFTIDDDGKISADAEWSAAEQLDEKVSAARRDSRVIVTYKDRRSSSKGRGFSWNKLTVEQRDLLDEISPPEPSVKKLGEARLNWLRGHSSDEGPDYDAGELRSREAEGGRLGEIVHSTPVYVGQPPYMGRNTGRYPKASDSLYSQFQNDNKNRMPMVYVGSNDGMLHGFNADDGSERFAYVPNRLFPTLSELTRQDYTSRPYVDLTPSINDVYIKPARGTNQNTLSWNTLLVGGLRAGGKGYFALNITDPEDLDAVDEVVDNVLWEFTENDDNRLGYSYSKPGLAMTHAEDGVGNNRWYAFFGNGYKAEHADGEAVLFALALEDGQDGVWGASDYRVIGTGEGTLPLSEDDEYTQAQFDNHSNGLGSVRLSDVDGDGAVDYAYAGDLRGNLYRFDLTSSSPSGWSATKIFQARYSGDGSVQPITNMPLVVRHPTGRGVLVVVGTGSWMTDADAISTEVQSIYGIWDDLIPEDDTEPAIDYPVKHGKSGNDLQRQVYTNQVMKVEGHDYHVRTLSDNAVDWSKHSGWYIDLDVTKAESDASGMEFPGERAIRNFQYRWGRVFVNSVLPKSSGVCSSGPGGFQLSFNPMTGGSFSKPVFDINRDGVFDVNDNLGGDGGFGNVIVGLRTNGTPTDATFYGNRRFTQLHDGSLEDVAINAGERGGRTSWRELLVVD